MMKSKSFITLISIGIMSANVLAVELDVGLSADFFDKYIWRGQVYNHKAVVQPSATIGKDGFSLNIWGNMPLADNDPGGRRTTFNELDYTLDYSGEAGLLSYSVGSILYTFPTPSGAGSATANPTTMELYAGASVDVLLSPSITLYRDIRANNGWYGTLGIGHSFTLAESVGLDVGASLGWGDSKYNEGYWATGVGSGLNDFMVGVALPLALGPVSVVPSVSYITLVESKIRSTQAYSGKADYFLAGIGLAVEF